MVTGAELAKALAEVQQALPVISKEQTADTGTYSYEYADLTAISKPLLKLLGEHGLSFLAKPTLQDGAFVLAYSLLHVSGEREDGLYPLPMGGNPQSIGSAISYGRRYCLCAVTGVAPGGSDDDGVAASAIPAQTAVEPAPAEPLTYAEQALVEAKGLVWDVWKAQHDGVGDALMFKAAYERWAQATPNGPGGSLEEAGVDELRSFRQHLVQTAEPIEEKAATDE
jgi:hypothetical protein